uniref:Glycosyltransferase family 25 n=1 Tax=Pithovirus LCPAC001 TaxID=2506585 RepID=A0A481Z1L4_9VIRU|nr:MAG: glycosyltransferase family 25 [Pithovirus LCPAC001]
MYSNTNKDSAQFYCLSFKNPKRKKNMEDRFKAVGLKCTFSSGVEFTDSRIKGRLDLIKRVFSIMYGHLDMIKDFYYNSGSEYGVFCEDDIHIHKNLAKNMPQILRDFDYMKLDVLLLGYLSIQKINKNITGFNLLKTENNGYRYYHFPNFIWGTQMYLLSKKHAKYLIDKYNTEYADKSQKNPRMVHFAADWTLTKDGNRALITPIMAVEAMEKEYINDVFRVKCHTAHYDSEYYI